MEKENLSMQEVNDFLNKKSGVFGISELSSDFRDLYAAAESGNERAELAIEMFCHSVKKYVGAYAAIMGGVDAIVFTAGIGENTVDIRRRVMEGLEFMGVSIDGEKNAVRGTVDITGADSRVKVLVIPTNEELMIARETERLVK